MTVSASKMQFCKLAPGVLSLKIKKHFEMKPLKILSGLIKWKERFLITGKVYTNKDFIQTCYAKAKTE